MAKTKTNESLVTSGAKPIEDLIRNNVSAQMPDGTVVIVPTDKIGNEIANKIVAAQIRAMIQRSIKTYNDKDMLPTPKDLKDLAEAAKSLTQFTKDLYAGEGQPEERPVAKRVERAGSDASAIEDVSFDAIEVQKP